MKSLFLRLVTQSAKCGIRVLVIAQRMDASILQGVARSNIETRFLLRSDAAGIEMMIPDLDDRQRAFLARARPGVGFMTAPCVPPTLFRGVALSYQQYLDQVETCAALSSASLPVTDP